MLNLFALLFSCSDTETAKEKAQSAEKITTKEQPTIASEVEQKSPKAELPPSPKCSAQLQPYRRFVNEYFVVIKKAKEGDLGAMRTSNILIKKAEKTSADLQSLHKEGTINSDCWKRYQQLQIKLSSAVKDNQDASSAQKQMRKKEPKTNNISIVPEDCVQQCQTDGSTNILLCIARCM